MSLCINPKCPRPDHPGNDHNRYCASCGSDLSLNDRYRVLRLLSDKTGFGKIYETYERATPKILKVLKEDWNTSSKVVALFEQEARVLGKLEHPGIPRVDGYFQHPVSPQGWITAPSVHCIVMEKVDGLNLDEWLVQQGNHPISQKQALQWLKQVVEVLELIHANHYFHRDIKPGNIMLNRSGQLVLIDFGTARDSTYTYMAKQQAGHKITAIASAGFTPPEQANGHAVPQSDFFALGRSFVQFLTGKHPLEMYDSNNDEFRWRNHTTNVSPTLLNLLDRMMARKPGERPANTKILLQEIEKLEKKLNKPTKSQLFQFPAPVNPSPAPPANSSQSSASVSTSLPSSTNPLQSASSTSSSSRLPARLSSLKPKWLINGALILAGLAGTHTCSVVVFASDPITLLHSQLFLSKTLTGHSDEVTSVAVSSDGQTIVSGSHDGTIKVWNLETGELLRTLSDSKYSGEVQAVAISPDGQTIVSNNEHYGFSPNSNNGIKVWKLETGELLRTLTGGNMANSDSVAISPDGQTIVSISAVADFAVWNLETGELLHTLEDSASAHSVAISPDGQTIVSGSNAIKIWNLETGELLHTLSEGSGWSDWDWIGSIAISPDGQTVISSSSNNNTWNRTTRVWNLETSEFNTLENSRSVNSIAISPDGQTIVSGGDAIKVWNSETGEWNVRTTGELLRILSGHSGWVNSVAISPDGRRIVSGGSDKTIKIWRLD